MVRKGLWLVGLVVAVAGTASAEAPAPPAPAKEDAFGRAPDFQKKLNEQVHYGLKIPMTLDQVLEQFLTRNDMPYQLNAAAFTKAGADKDLLKSTTIDPFDMDLIPRKAILMRLLEKIPCVSEKGTAVYVIRPSYIEITTSEAYAAEFFPGEVVTEWVAPPPLTTASFEEKPLADALKELARANDINIVLDGRSADAKTKVTAEFLNVAPEVAVRLLANMADLKLVRLANVYYVTTKENARALQEEEDKRRLERPKNEKKRENEKKQESDPPAAIYPGSKPAPSP
jgi:hypothetical protein